MILPSHCIARRHRGGRRTLGQDVGQAYLKCHSHQLGESGKSSRRGDDRPAHGTHTRPGENLTVIDALSAQQPQPEASKARPPRRSVSEYLSQEQVAGLVTTAPQSHTLWQLHPPT